MAVAGLLGIEAGLAWVIVGVWMVRAVWGRPAGMAWALALLVASLRWGTLGSADILAGARVLGGTVVVGPPLAAAASWLAVSGALLEESKDRGMLADAWPVVLTSVIALLALVAAFAPPGPGDLPPVATLSWWGAGAVIAALVVVGMGPVARRIPRPVLWAGSGVALGLVALAPAILQG